VCAQIDSDQQEEDFALPSSSSDMIQRWARHQDLQGKEKKKRKCENREKITVGSLAVTLGDLHAPLGLDEPGGGNHFHGLGDLLDVLGR